MPHIAHAGGPATVVYLGSPDIAVAPLQALVDAGHHVALVVTNPDRRRGRGGELSPTPVKQRARQLGLDVSHELDDVLSTDATFGVVVAYGHIVGNHILDVLPMVNIHFSLLPRWRGAAPLERAILAGDEFTGVCLMEIVEALDQGAIYARRHVAIEDLTLDELRQQLVDAACELLVSSIAAGFGEPEPQTGEITYARKLKPADFELDFARSARELHRYVRLGRAFTRVGGRRLGVLAATIDPEPHDHRPGTLEGVRIATGDGWLVLDVVQPEGKRPLAAAEWHRGARIGGTTILGNAASGS